MGRPCRHAHLDLWAARPGEDFLYWLKSAAAPRAVSGAARRVGCRGAPRSWRFAPSAQPTAPDTAHQTGWTFRRTVRLAAYFVAARFATSVAAATSAARATSRASWLQTTRVRVPTMVFPRTLWVPNWYRMSTQASTTRWYLSSTWEVPFWYLGLVEPSTERKALGQVIRALRELDGLSRDQLAHKALLGVDMVSKIEQGRKTPSAAALNRLAAALGLGAIDLSNRALLWAALRESPQASAGLLRLVATGSSSVSPAAILARSVTPVAAGAAMGAAAAGLSYFADKRSRGEIEDALRELLERRLEQASTEQDLADLAIALEATAGPGEPATG